MDDQSDPEMYPSKFAFRLIYNGKILTPLVDGCHEDCELCDIIHLKSKVDPIATRNTDCSVSMADQNPAFSLDTNTGIAVYMLLVLLSGLLGGVVTCLIMRRNFTRAAGRRKTDYSSAFDGDDANENGLELREGNFEDEHHESDSDFVNGNCRY